MKYFASIAASLLSGLAPIAIAHAAPAAAQAVPPADIRAEAEAFLGDAYPHVGPGVTTIVTRQGRPVFGGAHGAAAEGQPLAADAPLGLGSITKQFTAAIVLQLVAEGKLGLDDPLSRFFPDWPQPGAAATVRQLLNHSSGIHDFSKVPGWIQRNRDGDVSTAGLLTMTRELGSKAEPGAAWEYNNGGYVILGAVVEQVTGKPWIDAVNARIAGPLGLASLRLVDAASGGSNLLTASAAAGGLQATAADLAAWAQALHHGKVVAPALYAQMTAPAELAGGKTAPYGFGMRLGRLRGERTIHHGGAGRGIDAESIYLPGADVFVAVLGSSDALPTAPSVTARRLAALAIGAPFPRFSPGTADPQAVRPLVGVYKGEQGEVRFFERDGTYIVAAGVDEMRLKPAGNDRFYSASTGLGWLEFGRDAAGVPVARLHDPQSAVPEIYVRVGDIPADADVRVPEAVLRTYAGEYQTEALAVTVAIDPKGRLTMTPTDQPAIVLRPISQTEFLTEDGRMKLAFHPEGGAADRFTLHRGARELHGKRIVK